MFLEVLNTLMRTFIKASAALNTTKKYCNVKYEAEKGLKQFYLELSKAASQMVTLPDQVSFNARFLNYIPLEWKRAEEPKPRWKEDPSSKYSRKTDQKSVPICSKCGKIGQTKDCPKHHAASNEKPRHIATMEVTHPSEEESEDSLEDKPENNSGDSEASSFEVEDPYEGHSPNSEGEE